MERYKFIIQFSFKISNNVEAESNALIEFRMNELTGI